MARTADSINPLCQASAGEFHSEAQTHFSTCNKPRPLSCEGDAEWMNCEILRWAADQIHITPHLQGILIRLVRLMDDDGALSMKQTDIAPLIGLGERQTRAAIAALVEAKVIQRKRRGGLGGGRVCDALICNRPEMATGESQPLSEQPAESANCDTGGSSPLATGGNAQPATGDTSPLSTEKQATGDNAVELPVSEIEAAPDATYPQDACIGTGARADKLNLNTSSEPNPETKESSVESVFALAGEARTEPDEKLKSKRGSRLPCDWKPGDLDRKYAAFHGLTGEWLENTAANFVGYWSNLPGQKGLKLNWSQAWEGEVRKEAVAQRHKPSNVARLGQQQQRGPYRSGGVTRLAYTG